MDNRSAFIGRDSSLTYPKRRAAMTGSRSQAGSSVSTTTLISADIRVAKPRLQPSMRRAPPHLHRILPFLQRLFPNSPGRSPWKSAYLTRTRYSAMNGQFFSIGVTNSNSSRVWRSSCHACTQPVKGERSPLPCRLSLTSSLCPSTRDSTLQPSSSLDPK